MKAIILAGGEGARLRPYTYVLPKPLMPIGDTPILEIILKQLKHFGFKDVIIALSHKTKLVSTFFGFGEELGLNVSYSYEEKNLGTAGPLTLIKNLDDNFLFMNGDILTNLDYEKFMKEHVKSDTAITVASYPKTVKINLGVMETDDTNRVTEYIEKPQMIYQVSMGIYAFNRRVIKYIPDNEYFDFPDLVKKLIKEGENESIEFKSSALWSINYTAQEIEESNSPILKIYGRNASKIIIAKTIAAFLNSQGGHLIIGVKENKNHKSDEIIGIESEFKKLRDNASSTDGYRRMIVDAIIRPYFPHRIFNHLNDYIKIKFSKIYEVRLNIFL